MPRRRTLAVACNALGVALLLAGAACAERPRLAAVMALGAALCWADTLLP